MFLALLACLGRFGQDRAIENHRHADGVGIDILCVRKSVLLREIIDALLRFGVGLSRYFGSQTDAFALKTFASLSEEEISKRFLLFVQLLQDKTHCLAVSRRVLHFAVEEVHTSLADVEDLLSSCCGLCGRSRCFEHFFGERHCLEGFFGARFLVFFVGRIDVIFLLARQVVAFEQAFLADSEQQGETGFCGHFMRTGVVGLGRGTNQRIFERVRRFGFLDGVLSADH